MTRCTRGRLSAMLTRCLLAAVLSAILAVGMLAIQTSPSAYAASTGTTCRTINVSGDWWIPDIDPHMTVPVCYNGSRIWQNGPVTPGVNTIGYVLDDISWAGTYNSGGSWIGVGENYRVTIYTGFASFSCASRWMVNAQGNTFSYSRGC